MARMEEPLQSGTKPLVPAPLASGGKGTPASGKDLVYRDRKRREIAAIWQRVLKLNHLSKGESFFDLNGDSFSAVQIAVHIRDQLNYQVPLNIVFRYPTVDTLANCLDAFPSTEHRIEAAVESPQNEASQSLYWGPKGKPSHSIRELFIDTRHSGVLAKLSGSLEILTLELAVKAVVARHQLLHTMFERLETGEVSIRPRLTWSLQLEVCDIGSLSEKSREQTIQSVANRPFDLEKDIPFRACLFRFSPGNHRLLIVAPSMVADSLSMEIVLCEVTFAYGELLQDRSPSWVNSIPQYCAGAVRLESSAKPAQAGEAPPLYPRIDLPFDRPRAAGGHPVTENIACVFPAVLRSLVRNFCQREHVTTSVALLSALNGVLARYTSAEEIVIGCPVAMRFSIETLEMIGPLSQLIPIRTSVTGNPRFIEVVRKVGRDCTETLEQSGSRHSVPQPAQDFQITFELQSSGVAGQSGDLVYESSSYLGHPSTTDLSFVAVERGDELDFIIGYNRNLFDRETINDLRSHFFIFLGSALQQPTKRFSEMALLGEAEENLLLVEWNQTKKPYPRNSAIHDLFEEQVGLHPKSAATVFEGNTLSYDELNQRANRLALHLSSLGVQANQPVGIFMERSHELIIALLAIFKAGAAYVSLDPSYPTERLHLMVDDAKPGVILTQRRLQAMLPIVRGHVLVVDEGWSRGINRRVENPNLVSSAESLAYISYTSGSTGTPKGVCVTHRGVARLVKGTDFAHFGIDEVILQYAPVAFDASTFEIWGALLNGGTLAIAPPGIASLQDLGEFIRRHHVTTAWLTAGLFHQMIDHQIDSLKYLRQLIAGGDVLSKEHVAKALSSLKETRLINGYGPTENTTFSCCHPIKEVDQATRSIPIGRPIANSEAYVLDAHLQPVPIGVVGELYVGGDGLAQGYLNRREITESKFIAHPFSPISGHRLYRTGDLVRYLRDGNIEFIGRKDFQVKIRGYRIEPEEIQAVLGKHPGVLSCTVIATPGPNRKLVAYVVGAAIVPPAATLRLFLQERLPPYMVPSHFVFLDRIPLNPQGKVDRNLLPQPVAVVEKQDHVGASDPIEERLVALWENVLGTHPIGITDRFGDLGGDSLAAVAVIGEIQKTLRCRISVAFMAGSPSIREVAELIRSGPNRPCGESIVEIQAGTNQLPLFLVHGVGGGMFWGYANLAKHLGNDYPVYAFRARPSVKNGRPATIESLAQTYVDELLRFQPAGPYLLGGYCFGGNVAFEMARLLKQRGADVECLVLFNATPPNSAYEQFRPTPRMAWGFLKNSALASLQFLHWPRDHQKNFFRWKWRKFARLFTPHSMGTPLGERAQADDFIDLNAVPSESRILWAEHVSALRAYYGETISVDTVLIRTRGHRILSSFDEKYGWDDYISGKLNVHVVSGSHESLLDEPHAETSAAVLKQYLARANARHAFNLENRNA